MVEDICFHIVDLVQNSVTAGAGRVTIRIRDSRQDDTLTLDVEDDGKGMDAQTIENVQDPFFTTKTFKKVGLGIPLLKDTARFCHGTFAISSTVGRGTTVSAELEKSHFDCPPLGDIAGTIIGLLVSFEDVDIRFEYHSDAGDFAVSSAEIRAEAGGMHLSHPDILHFLREYFREHLQPLLAG